MNQLGYTDGIGNTTDSVIRIQLRDLSLRFGTLTLECVLGGDLLPFAAQFQFEIMNRIRRQSVGSNLRCLGRSFCINFGFDLLTIQSLNLASVPALKRKKMAWKETTDIRPATAVNRA